jgi:hypothetical protein
MATLVACVFRLRFTCAPAASSHFALPDNIWQTRLMPRNPQRRNGLSAGCNIINPKEKKLEPTHS